MTGVPNGVAGVRRRVRRRPGAGERGSASLELLGAIPVLVVVALAALQVAAFAFTVHATNQAVRDGARAHSLGNEPRPAIAESLPDSLTVESTVVVGGEVRLVVDVPRVAPFVPDMDVTRSAVMP